MNRNIIITGANRGIGNTLLETFAKNGDNIWACCRKVTDKFAAQIEKLCSENNVWIKPVVFELDNEESIKQGIKTILEEKKSIDVLINNAGITDTKLFMQTSVCKVRNVFDVNYFAPLSIMQLVLKKMMIQRKGCVINMASVAGIEHQAGRLAYGSSKAALIWATQGLAQEFGAAGVRINAIAPGAIETSMIADYSEEKINKIISEVSLRRLGKTEEIAKAALFLASDEASFINGQILRVDGGRLC